MRCNKHPGDLSSSVGVCASCLRERLFAVTAAQNQAQAQAQQDCRKSHTTSAATWQPHRRQHSTTPPVGPAQLATRKAGRFSSLFLSLFRSKTKTGSDSGPGIRAEPSPSWFPAMVPGRRRKQDMAFWPVEGASGARRESGRARDREMSPDDEHCRGGRSSGCSSESSRGWRKTPARRGGGHSRDVSGFGFWLSPLVRPSPHRRWNQKGVPPEKVPHLSSAKASFCKNRSRKLAGFGSYNANH